MSNENRVEEDESGQEARRGPNLVLIYGLLATALVAAMALAALIVLPFYRHH